MACARRAGVRYARARLAWRAPGCVTGPGAVVAAARLGVRAAAARAAARCRTTSSAIGR